jgi:hypothetical protein
MLCSEKDALLRAYRAALGQYQAIFDDEKLSSAKRLEDLEQALTDCAQRGSALLLHSEEHGC